MKVLGIRHLSVLLIGTLLLCHGVLGGMHLACDPLEWSIGGMQHSAEHQSAAGDDHEHPAGSGMSTAYCAVLALGVLGLLLRPLPEAAAGLRIWGGTRWSAVIRRVTAVMCPPSTPTPLALQVLRL